jgi:hypothetical protein
MTDYSEGGARLEFKVAASLPPRFDLCLEGLATVIPCELRHAGKNSAGVEFVKQGFRRSVSSALAAEKLLTWLADEKNRMSALNAGPVSVDAVEAVPRQASGHPLRAAIFSRGNEQQGQAVIELPERLLDRPAPAPLQPRPDGQESAVEHLEGVDGAGLPGNHSQPVEAGQNGP